MGGLMRRTSLLSVVVIAMTTTAAHAAPEFVRVSFVSADTDTEVGINWNTPGNVGTTVEWGAAPGNLNMTANGTSFVSTGALGYVHEVVISGLQPDTTYYYRAGDATDGFSPEYQFRTAPPQDPECGAFRFMFMADNRPDPTFGGGENYDNILDQAMAHAPAFILNGGDMVEDGENIGEWRDLLGYSEDVFNTTPMMPTIGNHDNGPGEGDGAIYNQTFALPRSMGMYGSGTEDYYYFTYGNAIFVSLSTETFEGGATPFADQAAWLDEVLTNNPKRWKVVYYHKPSYTNEVIFSISHEPNEEGQNAALIPVIDAHHVDLVLTSHNHWYERFEPTACATANDPNSDTPCSVGATNFDQGTVHIVSGGAGAFTIPEFLCGSLAGRAECSGDHHYVVFDISPDTMVMETWGAAPQPNQVIDTIEITKTPAASCAAPGADAGPSAVDASVAVNDGGGSIDDGGGNTVDDAASSENDATGNPGDGDPSGGCCEVGNRDAPGAGMLGLVLFVAVILRRLYPGQAAP
jgi:hypothetical protein